MKLCRKQCAPPGSDQDTSTEHQDGRHCLGGGGDFLLLSVRLALRAVGHDAAVIRGFRSEFDWAWPRSWACSTTDIRHSALSPALPWTGLGPRRVLPIAAAVVGVGALLFATGRSDLASVGRVLQGAGGVFALVGAIYIATKNFPASRAATLIGATQMFGMAGGSAGQFAVGPMIGAGIAWDRFWIGHGRCRLGDGCASFCSPSRREENRAARAVG